LEITDIEINGNLQIKLTQYTSWLL